MSGEDNLLRLVEAEDGDENNYHLQDQVGFILRRAHQRHVSIFASSKMVIEAENAAKLLAKDGIEAEVVDLRTLRPLDLDAIRGSIAKTNHAVVVNEGWTFCGYASELSATIMEHCFDDLDAPVARVAMPDMAIPYSEPLEMAVLPNAVKIAAAAKKALA